MKSFRRFYGFFQSPRAPGLKGLLRNILLLAIKYSCFFGRGECFIFFSTKILTRMWRFYQDEDAINFLSIFNVSTSLLPRLQSSTVLSILHPGILIPAHSDSFSSHHATVSALKLCVIKVWDGGPKVTPDIWLSKSCSKEIFLQNGLSKIDVRLLMERFNGWQVWREMLPLHSGSESSLSW